MFTISSVRWLPGQTRWRSPLVVSAAIGDGEMSDMLLLHAAFRRRPAPPSNSAVDRFMIQFASDRLELSLRGVPSSRQCCLPFPGFEYRRQVGPANQFQGSKSGPVIYLS